MACLYIIMNCIYFVCMKRKCIAFKAKVEERRKAILDF